MATDPDDPDLRARVAELEATVEAQQQTIQQLLPSRRRVLQAGGLLAGGGVLGALSADRASADVTGQVGTQQDRVDVFAGAVDANSVKTGSLSAGSSETTFTFPPERTRVQEVDTTSPATSFAPLTLSALDNDAIAATINVLLQGDGSDDNMRFLARKNGGADVIEIRGYAGHGGVTTAQTITVPVNNQNEIEYRTNRTSRVIIRTLAYF